MRLIISTFLIAVQSLLFISLASAAPVTPSVRTEIDALLSILEKSACEFNRNGAWHSAREAKAHLLSKLEYLERKNAVASTEQFIERGATSSSFSGKPYLVKCTNADPVASSEWLSTMLKTIRSAQPAASSNSQ
ncbi:DUF5329 domain-containing protein [Dechloromonas sp. A34]|uniref:DUF5329 domain-containing protein n=1 Tax=Dechloromonas sp. A34 TaxID=447588 RepID=UPI00224897F5|nr:DUF5329 domain-containing protein [Dechloromonas sp. A34]